jgi:hypothetical protein
MSYINELGNKVLSELAGMKNFFKNKFNENLNTNIDPLDMKLFFVFSNATEKQKKSSD